MQSAYHHTATFTGISIQILYCDMVLVYLGRGVLGGTKEKPFLHRPEPKRPVPRPETDDEYVRPVYEQESPPLKCFTQSMGSAPSAESPPHATPESSDTEAASDSSPAPPTKRQGCPSVMYFSSGFCSPIWYRVY